MKRPPVGLLAFFVLAVSPAMLLAGEENLVPLATSGGRLIFDIQEGIALLKQAEAAGGEPTRAWIDGLPPVPLWTLTILDSNKNPHTVTALDGQPAVHASSGMQLVLEWVGIQPGNLRVLSTVVVRENQYDWHIEFELRDPGYTLWDFIYPEIGPLALTENDHAIVPYGWGVLHGNPRGRRSGGVYPSASWAMPFAAVSDGTTGMYLGVHESAGYFFTFFVGKRQGHEDASLGVRHAVENMGHATRWRMPYAVTTVLFPGDWYESARIYHAAAKKTPWGNIPPLAERADIPRWLLDTDLWFVGSCHDEATANQVIEFADYFQVPVSAHIYQWHEIPFDDHYPEYFPAKPGFQQAVEKVQQAGIAVMPYINGRLWDPATESWKHQNAETACAIGENGEKYIEVYGSKVPLSPMCPFTELWKTTVTNLVDRLLNEVSVKAVYIDQISAAAAKPCFAEGHGHPLGGGTYWIQGYRDLLQRCRRIQPPGTALTTEENADPWNDQLHAWLMVNTREEGGEIVPLYPAVYGGRAISFGFQYIQGDDFTYRFPFRLKMARAFVFGSQLGWVGTQVLQEANQAEARYLKALCQARHASRDALQFGELLPPLALEGGGTVSWTDANYTSHTQPAVWGTAWRTPAGKLKIAFTNVADEERTVTFSLDSRHIREFPDKSMHLLAEDKTIVVTCKSHQPGLWQGAVTLPPRSARVLAAQN
ncbi:MAG TPA: DUF6259 domain-containing protein [bacterium]|nr:DUF6259 domain-containing protein [bacterium]HPP02289.1 DUF6259 domain-containing protein [bacterium]